MSDDPAKAIALNATGAARNEKDRWGTGHSNTAKYPTAYVTLAAIERGQVPAHLVDAVLAALPVTATRPPDDIGEVRATTHP